MSSVQRSLSFSLAINEALRQTMAEDPSVMVLGQGVKSPWYVGNTVRGLREEFGGNRVIDTPVSESAMTGAAVGAAMAGMRPVIVHPRMDFMVYALDAIVNEAANWHYMSGGRAAVPVVFWGIINRGGEQAAQHSQALHSVFAHVPGLKVVAPSCPVDAKGLMVAAIRDDNPVVYIDDRWLYGSSEAVPEHLYETPIGRAVVRRQGDDVTILTFSHLVPRALRAAELLSRQLGVSCEVVDLRSLKPLDREVILAASRRTGRVVICDIGWRTGGIGAEIAATIAESGIALKVPMRRVALPDVPAPASRTLEDAYYPTEITICTTVEQMLACAQL
jgi:pyruvate dehydrogenase E1 component beta subunit